MCFRFTIRTMFWFTAFVAAIFALGAYYSRIEQRYSAAQHQYDAADAKFDAGLSTDMDVCAESFVLYLAERERWFRGSEALKNHVERLKSVEERIESKIPVTL